MSTGRPSMERSVEYAQVDVFAEHALEGNQLAIFPDARELSDAEMQALARETNFAETTFVLPREAAVEREFGVRVRIFTTQEELPFAGHPTLGTASWLYWNHPVLRGAEEIVLDLAGGRVPVRFRTEESAKAGVYGAGLFGTMRQRDPVFGAVHEPGAVAEALGLSVDDLDVRTPVETVSTGLAFCMVRLKSLAVAQRLRIPQAKAEAYLRGSDAKFFFCMAPAGAGAQADWRNRMQFYGGEDPATGSASGCAIAYLVKHELVASGRATVFEQGVEMLRPSRITVSARVEGETVLDVLVGGRTILVAAGRFFLPGYTRFPHE